MRLLWISRVGSYYNGVGWMQSLKEIVEQTDNTIGLAYLSSVDRDYRVVGKTNYFPITCKKNTFLARIKEHYGGYKNNDGLTYLKDIQQIIETFKPDVIHLFGLEHPLSDVIGHTDIPVVVHIQGIMAPCDNAFFPAGFNERTFMFPPTASEWIMRNGFIYDKKKTHARALRELDLIKGVKFAMVRTHWDLSVVGLLAPDARCFHVDEVLRSVFYEKAGRWNVKDGVMTLVSTISPVPYKGLDLILKTAALLTEYGDVRFKWKVVGLEPDVRFVKVLEKTLGINGKEVSVEYQGVKTAEELSELLLDSSAYVHPSYIDNSPNSVCEAQMLGVPTIATNVGGIASLIENERDGFLVPANGPYELAALLLRLSRDKSLCANVSRNGCRTATSRHDKKKILNDLIDSYSSVIGM